MANFFSASSPQRLNFLPRRLVAPILSASLIPIIPIRLLSWPLASATWFNIQSLSVGEESKSTIRNQPDKTISVNVYWTDFSENNRYALGHTDICIYTSGKFLYIFHPKDWVLHFLCYIWTQLECWLFQGEWRNKRTIIIKTKPGTSRKIQLRSSGRNRTYVFRSSPLITKIWRTLLVKEGENSRMYVLIPAGGAEIHFSQRSRFVQVIVCSCLCSPWTPLFFFQLRLPKFNMRKQRQTLGIPMQSGLFKFDFDLKIN